MCTFYAELEEGKRKRRGHFLEKCKDIPKHDMKNSSVNGRLRIGWKGGRGLGSTFNKTFRSNGALRSI